MRAPSPAPTSGRGGSDGEGGPARLTALLIGTPIARAIEAAGAAAGAAGTAAGFAGADSGAGRGEVGSSSCRSLCTSRGDGAEIGILQLQVLMVLFAKLRGHQGGDADRGDAAAADAERGGPALQGAAGQVSCRWASKADTRCSCHSSTPSALNRAATQPSHLKLSMYCWPAAADPPAPAARVARSEKGRFR